MTDMANTNDQQRFAFAVTCQGIFTRAVFLEPIISFPLSASKYAACKVRSPGIPLYEKFFL